ncbi:ATP-binding protein [Mesorhizobium sp. M0106]|uniref:ATP-binding protein n=1 Tax=Mesorhizobium sp. M0106 TaxID=2956880 RepID=UPI00333D5869
MNQPTKVNRPAPLKNVSAFATLLETMVERDPKLPGLAAFFSPSGYGKTESAIYGANKYRAAYIECGQFTTARSLLSDILKELGEPNPRGSVEELKNKVIMLMVFDPRKPLIIDEAHFIAHKRFVDLLREVSDKSGASVIMIGEEGLPTLLERFERVHNRVLEWLPALPCDAEDFALLAANRCGGVRVAPDLAGAILDKTKGNTRRIVINLATVSKVAQLTGANVIDLATFGGIGAINASPKFSARKSA